MALSLEDKKQGKYINIKNLKLEVCAVPVYVQQLDFPILITRQVFKNGDGSAGTLYLASNDLTLSSLEMTTIYQKRWKVAEYHKSIKSNTAFAKSPTKTLRTQQAHFIASIIAFVKLEHLKMRSGKNHFAIKQLLHISAAKAAWSVLSTIKNGHAA